MHWSLCGHAATSITRSIFETRSFASLIAASTSSSIDLPCKPSVTVPCIGELQIPKAQLSKQPLTPRRTQTMLRAPGSYNNDSKGIRMQEPSQPHDLQRPGRERASQRGFLCLSSALSCLVPPPTPLWLTTSPKTLRISSE
mmetsp:Transcript_49208/g.76826  ORF Transcript_49208/g.76826 Transcript_49208/m.76826 type:complete len:141 (+) Transcript_49208:1175-1597(+)